MNEIAKNRIVSHFFSLGFSILESDVGSLKDSFLLIKDNKKSILWVKIQSFAISMIQIRNLFERIFDIERAHGRMDSIYLISNMGYTTSSYSFANLYENRKISLFMISDYKLVKLNDENSSGIDLLKSQNDGKTYIGIFTCKGGVGKTTIAAHLSGALACHFKRVALFDLDPEENLYKITNGRLKVFGKKDKELFVKVYNRSDIDSLDDVQEDIVIFDCSPALERNFEAVVKKFNYVLIPTTLNPLGLSSNAMVIERSLEEIRSINSSCKIFSFVNNYHDDKTRRNRILNRVFYENLKRISQKYSNFEFVMPESVSIRFSNMLYYWGMNLYDNSVVPTIAFRDSSNSYPREDYFSLCEYLQSSTKIKI